LEEFPILKESPLTGSIQRAFNGEFVHQDIHKSVAPGHYFENFFIPLRDENNYVDRVLAIAHDVTSIMEAHENLKQLNGELEKSNRDLEQFAYVASHDLQEPLRKIQIFSELSSMNLNNTEVARQYLDKIHSSANRMTDLIKAVLNYSRLSKTDNTPVDVDLNAVIANLKVDLELLLEEKKAIIQYDRLPTVKGIPLQLNQLFLNLISNSLKFTERQPEITLSSSFVSADQANELGLSKNENRYVEIILSDNGIGFDQQYANQVFSIFQRLHPGDKYPGTGIGLALCKKIVENHGGQIFVRSEKDSGSTFFIYLPAARIMEEIRKSSSDIVTRNL
jgi:light-regulated signal transduction histidine kinase (bacteriophytochrome)